ncbi:hypothetical protein OPT61_g3192 [Boeremia exigua]|uniref:Uncharacterized protein n=1 Tax=Boeremia exigua TaxID=749465 RepID=A0ACC2IIR9_9PLEO|nr:hypothetical protein OPT61_g3192 [Boeremia exigua]
MMSPPNSGKHLHLQRPFVDINPTSFANIVQSGDAPTMSKIKKESKGTFNFVTRQTESPLLCLPAELRNIVYAYTLGGNTWSINVSGGQAMSRADNAFKYALAILRVNRQIYEEAHLFPYIYNTFQGRHSGHLRVWIQSLSTVHRESIVCIKHCQRSYLIRGTNGVDVSPVFWMDTPHMTQWRLNGLRRIEIEIALNKWGLDIDEAESKAAKVVVLAKLRRLVEEEHPGVTIDVALRPGF